MENSIIHRINSSGLFNYKSNIDEKLKIEILDWYDSLPPRYRSFVMILRSEAADDMLDND